MLLILFLGVGFLLYSVAGDRSAHASRQVKTDAALAMAKEALLGRAVADPNHPGSLPCPDTDDDGIAELFAGTACPSYLGRLPWKTLELPDLRDGDGERLWYMLSPAFRDNNVVEPLNTDTIGDITVFSGTNATTLTARAAAVIFAPGPLLGAQARSNTQAAACPVTGTTIAQSLCAANYLETASTINNANATGPFISAPATTTFNDRLLAIDSVELMTLVEARAVREILSALSAYRTGSACDCYPWADNDNDGFANNGALAGRVPLNGANTGFGNGWSNATPAVTIPTWLKNNEWWRVFFYTVADDQSYDHNFGTLTFDGVSGKDVILITTGAATAARPSMPLDYVDDGQNADNGVIFITPADTTSMNRDRVYVLP